MYPLHIVFSSCSLVLNLTMIYNNIDLWVNQILEYFLLVIYVGSKHTSAYVLLIDNVEISYLCVIYSCVKNGLSDTLTLNH